MPINVTLPYSGTMSLQEFIIKILVFTLAPRLNSKVSKLKIEWFYHE